MTVRLFAVYALLSAIPVLALGLILAANFRSEAQQRGLTQGRKEAALVAHTAIQPLLDGRPLNEGVDSAERPGLNLLAAQSYDPQLLRLRLRGLDGRVVFSDDGSGLHEPIDPNAVRAGNGQTITTLTRLNADDGTDAPHQAAGPRVIEVYLPLMAGIPRRRVGVLEVYLPYAPIQQDLSRLLSTLYRDLIVGLGGLYLVLFAITASVSSRLRREAKRNAFLADHDTLTGLPNRSSFLRFVAAALEERYRNPSESVVVAIIDLDRFKAVNDTLGHPNGDALLRELAARLSAEIGDAGIVTRLGGDEFGIVLPGGEEEAVRVLWQLRDATEREIPVAGLMLAAQASIGYVVAPADGRHPDTLVQRADVAMYAAKERHAGVGRWAKALERYDAGSLRLLTELRHAIDDDQLVLHYQPQLDLRSGAIVAVEALVRWQHPVQGLLFPDRFLPLAEQNDVIDRLTRWVLRRALRDIQTLDRMTPHPGALRVAVNVSARSLGRGELADEVLGALADSGVPASQLVVEVTETAILADPVRAVAELERLGEAGVTLSLDDFGQGQTSVSHLSTLPLHELKIDRSLVGDLDEAPTRAAIVSSLVELGHNLGLQVVAEGVETEAVAARLRAAGTDLAQGYLISRPVALEVIAERFVSAPPGSTVVPLGG